MPSSDYDRPVPRRPEDATEPPSMSTSRGVVSSPLGITLAIIFVVMVTIAVLGSRG